MARRISHRGMQSLPRFAWWMRLRLQPPRSDVFVESLERWTRRCTIRSAVEMQQSRISLLASIYERTPCCHRNHAPLAPVVLDLLCDKPEELGLCLDVLCRAALVLSGIEHYSPSESALILGVSRTAVEVSLLCSVAVAGDFELQDAHGFGRRRTAMLLNRCSDGSEIRLLTISVAGTQKTNILPSI